MAEYSKEYLKKTIEVWHKKSKIPLSIDDAEEITRNMTALFKFINELEEKYGEKE